MANTKNRKASFVERLGALIIDFFIIYLITSLISYPINMNNNNYEKLQNEVTDTVKKYQDKEIDISTYTSRISDITYDISKETVINSLLSIVIASMYYIVFQFKNAGQTFGKKLFKIRIVKTDNTDLSINDIMFRSLIVNFILYDLISVCITLFVGKNMYFPIVAIFEFIQYLIIFITAIMILTRKDKRGLHDLIVKTEVIKLKEGKVV